MTMLIDRERAIGQIGPERLDRLAGCFRAAWDIWFSRIRQSVPLCDPAAMATFFRELVLEQVREKFADQPGVVILDAPSDRRFLLVIDNTLVVQFKKLTRDFQTRNNPTKTSETFDRQLPLEGLPSFPRLTAGYQFSEFRDQVAGIWLAFLVGDECQWYHSLDDGEHSMVLDLDFPQPPVGRGAADQEMAEDRLRRTQQDRAVDAKHE